MFNNDHKWTFNLHKSATWSKRSINVTSLIAEFSRVAQAIKAELLDATFRYEEPRSDRTLTLTGECAIEFILRKCTEQELTRGGRYPL